MSKDLTRCPTNPLQAQSQASLTVSMMLTPPQEREHQRLRSLGGPTEMPLAGAVACRQGAASAPVSSGYRSSGPRPWRGLMDPRRLCHRRRLPSQNRLTRRVAFQHLSVLVAPVFQTLLSGPFFEQQLCQHGPMPGSGARAEQKITGARRKLPPVTVCRSNQEADSH